MTPHVFYADVHISSPEPGRGVVTEFALVDAADRNWVHGHIGDDVWLDIRWARDTSDPAVTRESVTARTRPGGDPSMAVFEMLNQWLNAVVGRSPGHQPPVPVFVARDVDLTWFADGFRRAGLPARFERGDEAAHGSLDTSALAYIADQKHGASA